jgi:putative heme-binding domain-containing protein
VSQLFSQAAAMGEDNVIADAINIACTPMAERYEPWQFTSLAELLDVLEKRKWAIHQRLAEPTRNALARTIEQARDLAADSGRNEEIRAAAVRLLKREPDKRANDIDLLRRLLVPQTPPSVQQAIVAHAAGDSDKQIAGVLLAGWRSHGPTLRAQILSVLASRSQWVETLLDNLESGGVSPADIDASMRQRLLATKDNALRSRLQGVLAEASAPDRKTVIEQFATALRLTGDEARGKIVFEKKCANCHRQGEIGHEVGPNLASLTDKTSKALLASILDPSAAVEAKYVSYIVITAQGRSLSGILSAETGSSIALLAAEGRTESILRSDIDELQSTGKSLMPDGLEKELTPQDMSDLIAFIRRIEPPKVEPEK